jgi:hypothetical protein
MASSQPVPGAEGPLGRAGRSPGNGPGEGTALVGAGPAVPAAVLAASRWALAADCMSVYISPEPPLVEWSTTLPHSKGQNSGGSVGPSIT